MRCIAAGFAVSAIHPSGAFFATITRQATLAGGTIHPSLTLRPGRPDITGRSDLAAFAALPGGAVGTALAAFTGQARGAIGAALTGWARFATLACGTVQTALALQPGGAVGTALARWARFATLTSVAFGTGLATFADRTALPGSTSGTICAALALRPLRTRFAIRAAFTWCTRIALLSALTSRARSTVSASWAGVSLLALLACRSGGAIGTVQALLAKLTGCARFPLRPSSAPQLIHRRNAGAPVFNGLDALTEHRCCALDIAAHAGNHTLDEVF